jgi:hypothetical protein
MPTTCEHCGERAYESYNSLFVRRMYHAGTDSFECNTQAGA